MLRPVCPRQNVGEKKLVAGLSYLTVEEYFMNLLGIGGKAGSGKSVFAGLLAAQLAGCGYPARVDAFGVDIKRLARREGWDGVKDENGRRLLQEIGQTMVEDDPEFWIRELKLRNLPVLANSRRDEFLIISDVRRKEEADYIRSKGGKILYMIGRFEKLSPEAADHITESMDWVDENCDIAVDNTGGLDDLLVRAEAIAKGRAFELRGGNYEQRKSSAAEDYIALAAESKLQAQH